MRRTPSSSPRPRTPTRSSSARPWTVGCPPSARSRSPSTCPRRWSSSSTSSSAGVPVQVGFQRRFDPAYRRGAPARGVGRAGDGLPRPPHRPRPRAAAGRVHPHLRRPLPRFVDPRLRCAPLGHRRRGRGGLRHRLGARLPRLRAPRRRRHRRRHPAARGRHARASSARRATTRSATTSAWRSSARATASPSVSRRGRRCARSRRTASRMPGPGLDLVPDPVRGGLPGRAPRRSCAWRAARRPAPARRGTRSRRCASPSRPAARASSIARSASTRSDRRRRAQKGGERGSHHRIGRAGRVPGRIDRADEEDR